MRRAQIWAVVGLTIGVVGTAQAQPYLKGNDTGGIIAYELATQADVKLLAVEHCARYGKVVKFLAADAQYGGYISFACRWVPYGAAERPLSVRY